MALSVWQDPFRYGRFQERVPPVSPMKTVLVIRTGVLALVATAVAVFAAPTPSLADGDDYYFGCPVSTYSCQTGVKITLPAGECDTSTAATGSTIVCVDYSGDYVYVKDTSADSHSALAWISSDAGGVHDRLCRNPHGKGTWAKCNFDWSEAAEKVVYGGRRIDYTDHEISRIWKFSNK
jgi:hypothetical protein